MPFISIIVVTWNNENFIEQALRSCIDKNVDDYEIIVVHNASEDQTGELIRRVASDHKNLFNVIENDRNEGLGEARNIGIRNANGEYILFLDGDDWFEPNAISTIYKKLKFNHPDILIFDYQRAWDTGDKKKNMLSHLLQERDISDPRKRAPVLRNFCVAWNKAYRKSFIQKAQSHFPSRYYEDIFWNFKNLCEAKHCYVIPFIAINYRQRSGSITKSVNNKHFDIILQYTDVMNFMKHHPEYIENYFESIYGHGRSQILNVLNAKRIPKSSYRIFLKQACSLLYEWRQTASYKKRDLTLSIGKFGIPSLYFLGKSLKNKILYAKKAKRAIVHIIYKFIFLNLPINNRKIYIESYWGQKIDCNPLALARTAIATNKFIVITGIKRNIDVENFDKFKLVTINSLIYWYHIATSKFVISNANLHDRIVKRKKTIHVQTWHGTPLKVMGIDIRPYNEKEMNWRKFRNRCQRWDYVISSNPHSSAVWRRAMPYDYKILETGYPRNDLFFNSNADNIAQIKRKIGIPVDKKIAFYAPTFRDYDRNNQFGHVISFKEIRQSLGNNWVLLIRSHYLTPDDTIHLEEGIINVSSYPISNELCLISDLLITDYSSIMFDYACLNRPIIIFIYDYDKYTQFRGLYFDIQTEAPGAVTKSKDALLNILAHKIYENSENQKKLAIFREKFCPWDDGFSSQRVLSKILNTNLFDKTEADI